jgi:hypothetical protein
MLTSGIAAELDIYISILTNVGLDGMTVGKINTPHILETRNSGLETLLWYTTPHEHSLLRPPPHP